MLPPGMALLCVGPRAVAAERERWQGRRSFWDWHRIIGGNAAAILPVHPGHPAAVRAARGRHHAARRGPGRCLRAPRAAGERRPALPLTPGDSRILCETRPIVSNSLTAVVTPEGIDSGEVHADRPRALTISLSGSGWGAVRGKIFRIGHLGALNELEVLGTLGGVEMALEAGVPVQLGPGVAAAQQYLLETA